jgi:hypothetical protein
MHTTEGRVYHFTCFISENTKWISIKCGTVSFFKRSLKKCTQLKVVSIISRALSLKILNGFRSNVVLPDNEQYECVKK